MTVDTDARKLAAQAISEVALGQSGVNDQTAAAAASAAIATTKALVATGQAEIATEQAALAITQGTLATSQAQSAQAAAAIKNVLDSPVTAGGTLPVGVFAISGGVGTGTGGTPGSYEGGVSGGPEGFRWQYTIGSDGSLESYEITNSGITLSGAVPTLSLPRGTGAMTGQTIPTAYDEYIPAGFMFYAPSEDGMHLLAWGNNAGTLASAPFGGTQLSIPLAAAIPPFGIGTLAERSALPTDQLVNGLHYFATDNDPPRWYMRVTAGNQDPKGVVATTDEWFGYYTPAEIKNLEIDFTGLLPAANVQNLFAALADITDLYAIKIADFRALATTTDANPPVDLSWGIKGAMPDAQTIAWDGHTVALDGKARSFTPPDWDDITIARVVGNSLSDTRDDNGTTVTHWPTIFAAATGISIANDAAYSSDWVEPLRFGVTPIMLTIDGDTLPAAGTSASVTAINGTAPSTSPGDSVSFLSVGDATVVTGLTMGGRIGDRHVTVSVPDGGSALYSVEQDAGGAAVALDGPVLFVPDHALLNGKGVTINAGGQNYFDSGVEQTYEGHTGYFNPQAFRDDALYRASARGWPVLEFPVLPQADWATTGAGNPYDAMTAFNALRETFAPQCKMRDAAGRTMLQRLQSAAISGNANDAADVAAGLIPRSLRILNGDGTYDPIHLSVMINAGQTVSGQQVLAAFVGEAIAALSAPPAVTQSTVFTLSATGTQASTGSTSSDTAVAEIELSAAARLNPLGGMTSGAWHPITGMPRLWLTGTGSVSFQARDRAGSVTDAPKAATSATGAAKVSYPYFGAGAVAVLPTITGSLTVEII